MPKGNKVFYNKTIFRLDRGQIEVVDDMLAIILKKKSRLERLKCAFGMWHSARVQVLSCLRSVHLDWDEDMIQKEAAKRLSHGAV